MPRIPPPVLLLMAWVYGFIACSSVLTVVLPALRGPAKKSLRQAINSWWPPALLAGAAVAGGRWVALAIFAVVSAWSVREYLSWQPAEVRRWPCALLAWLTVPICYAALATGAREIYWGAALAWLLAVLPLLRIAAGGSAPAGSAARLQLALGWLVFGLSHVAWLFFSAPLRGPAGNSGFAAVLFISVMSNDASQFSIGKALGRTPLAPRLSPKKTWEGLLGGVAVTAAIGALAAPLVTPLGHGGGALLGTGLALSGTVGDLAVSALKREAKVKDSGSVLPGQGGVLDRCDSLIFTAPLYVYGLQLLFG